MHDKVAMLVCTSFVTRVMVPKGSTEDQILEAAKPITAHQVQHEYVENVEELFEDLEEPYHPSQELVN
jgi:hypothetical protein